MRNLHPDEIYDQVKAIDQESRLYHSRPLSNIVFMGMGEPLMNYNNVLKSIDKITSEEGLGMSPKTNYCFDFWNTKNDKKVS